MKNILHIKLLFLLFLLSVNVNLIAQIDDYPWPNSTFNTSNAHYGMYYRNCTDWVAWKLNQNQDNNPTNSPHSFWNNMYSSNSTGSCNPTGAAQRLSNACRWGIILQNNGYYVSSTPTAGAIAHWNNTEIGGVGHVAYVETVQSNGIPILSHYNWVPDSGDYAITSNRNAPRYIRYNIFELIGSPIIQTIYQGGSFNMSASIKNNHSVNVSTNIRASLYSMSNQFLGVLEEKQESFSAGQTKTISFYKSNIISAPGDYKIFIETRVNDGTPFTLVHKFQQSSTISVAILNQSCNPPTTTLSSPSSGTNYNVGQNINLQWTGNGNGCAIQDYQIELTAPNGNIGGQTQTTHNFSFTATTNGLGTWQWRARTRNTDGVWGTYTSPRSFTISQASTNYTISVSANPSVGGGVTGGGSFSNGSGCSLVATPNTGYTFTNWTENGTVVSTNSTYTFTVSSNRSLVANFTQQGTWYTCPNYNFSPSINSNWNTSSSSLQTSSNKIYRFLAVPGRTYTFKTGCGDGATATFNTVLNLLDNNCNTIASDDNSCESQRSSIQWTCNYTSTNWVYLMVRGFSTSNSGDYTLAYREITPTSTYNVSTSSLPIAGGNTSGSGNYNQGQSCTLTATSNSGYTFSHWSENGTSVSSNASYTFNVAANRTLVANFTQNPTGSGCTGGTQYPGNTLIPSSTWKTQSGMYTGDYSLYRVYPGVTYEWSMCSADGAAANFDSQLTLIRYSDNQIIKFNNDYCGDDAKIIWTSDFYGDVKVLLNTYNCQSGNDWGTIAYRISNPSDYSSIVVSSSPYYMGNVAGEGSFVNGQTVTLTATPNNGYQFASWKENGNVVSTSSTYQFTVNGNRNLVANFTTALGTNETYKEKSEISPNPFNDFLQVSSNTADIIEIQLFDSSGKLVLTKDLSKKVKEIKLNTSKVIKGIYILKINKENKIESIKVIKK